MKVVDRTAIVGSCPGSCRIAPRSGRTVCQPTTIIPTTRASSTSASMVLIQPARSGETALISAAQAIRPSAQPWGEPPISAAA